MYFYLAMVLTMSLSRHYAYFDPCICMYVIALLLFLTHVSLYSESASTTIH
jgi:hypothetical protein